MVMGLFIPTSQGSSPPFSGITLVKGQLYNLDLNEFLSFQFNPNTFEWAKKINWGEITWKGNVKGGDLQFINIGPRKIDLPLLYMADPGAPEIEYTVEEAISTDDLKMDFQAIKEMIERWEGLIEGKGRPSRIRIIVGPNYFDGVVTDWSFRIVEFFSDLTAKEVLIALRFREWQLQ